MNFKSLKSGSDIRGTAIGNNPTLTPDAVGRLSIAFTQMVANKTGKKIDDVTIALGRDSRISGPLLMSCAAESICRAGATVLDFGMCTTPAMYMSILTPGFEPDGAIMLTASHHPSDKNGMKFFTEDGGLESAEISQLITVAENLPPTETLSFAGSIIEKAFLPTYKEILISRIKGGLDTDIQMPLLGLHVVVDAGNGVGGFYADVLQSLGAWVDGSQFLEPDGTFPNHSPNPENEEAMLSLSKAVLANDADLGVIFDADCDRAAIVDQTGRSINRNRLIALISAILLNQKPGITIVTDSVTSSGLSKFIGEWGGIHYRYKRGYRNVIDEAILLNKQGIDCPLAIETSGHAALRDNHFLDDGMYLVTVLIVEAMLLKQDGKTLSSLITDLQEPVESTEIRLSILDENFQETGRNVIAKVIDFATAMDSWHIAPDNREGVRINFDLSDGVENGWFLLRLSVHDPVLPLNAESDVKGGLYTMLNALYEVIKDIDGIDVSALKHKLHQQN